MALQEHASIWANSALICIKDITFLLPVWNIFCLFCPSALPSHANHFIFCDVFPDAPLLMEIDQVFTVSSLFSTRFTSAALISQCVSSFIGVHYRRRRSDVNIDASTRNFSYTHSSRRRHHMDAREQKMQTVSSSIFVFWLPAAYVVDRKKKITKYFQPIFRFKGIIHPVHSICESGFMCCQYFKGERSCLV